MTGIEKIAARIEQDARAAGGEVLEKARREAKEIIAGYEKEAEALRRELAEKGAGLAESRCRRTVGTAQLESRKLILDAKQKMIGEAFEKAASALQALPEKEKTGLLARLCAEASRTGAEQIVLSEAEHKAIGKKVCEQANSRLKKEGRPAGLALAAPRDIPGGGVMLSAGDVEVNCSFLSLIEAQKARGVADVAKILFEEG